MLPTARCLLRKLPACCLLQAATPYGIVHRKCTNIAVLFFIAINFIKVKVLRKIVLRLVKYYFNISALNLAV
jgi:hypothetical protein